MVIQLNLNLKRGICERFKYSKTINDVFREEKESLARLTKFLSDSSKTRRIRNTALNLQITVLGWLVEVFGFLTIVIGVYILGHENSNVTMTLHILAIIIYTIILPCSILINSAEVKQYIAESQWYAKLTSNVGWKSKQIVETDSEKKQITEERSSNGALSNENLGENEETGVGNEEVLSQKTGQDSEEAEDLDLDDKPKRRNKLHDVEVIDLE